MNFAIAILDSSLLLPIYTQLWKQFRKETMNHSTKLIQKLKQRDKELQLLLSQSWERDNCMGSNREKSNITIAIMEKLRF